MKEFQESFLNNASEHIWRIYFLLEFPELHIKKSLNFGRPFAYDQRSKDRFIKSPLLIGIHWHGMKME